MASKVPAILFADKPPRSLKIAVSVAKAMATSLRHRFVVSEPATDFSSLQRNGRKNT